MPTRRQHPSTNAQNSSGYTCRIYSQCRHTCHRVRHHLSPCPHCMELFTCSTIVGDCWPLIFFCYCVIDCTKEQGPMLKNRQTLSGNRMLHNFLFLFVCHWAYASIAHAIGTARIVAYAEQGLCNGTMSIRLSVCLSIWKNFKNRSTFSDVAERAYRIVFVEYSCV